MAEAMLYYGTGRRKTSVARVRMKHGDGKIVVNDKPMDEYFGGLETSKLIIKQPLEITNTLGRYDISVTIRGGGKVGGASAIRHGITRALMLADPGFRTPLKRAGFVTRDSRIKERKKYGMAGARKRFQFSKR